MEIRKRPLRITIDNDAKEIIICEPVNIVELMEFMTRHFPTTYREFAIISDSPLISDNHHYYPPDITYRDGLQDN